MNLRWTDKMYDIDPYIPKLKFNEEIYKSTKKLKIGYYTNDNYFSLAPANSRAVLEAVDILAAQGHEMVEFMPVRIKELSHLYISLFTGDEGNDFFGALQGEAIDKRYTLQYVMLRYVPSYVKTMLSSVLYYFGERRLSTAINSLNVCTAAQYWKVTKK
jgi:Asp-tRNA(Asn)/Glu-tRNA(Gln) amidotransferase A subunit family amidase